MNTLVTGATGFIGRALCAKLQADGCRVFGTTGSGDRPSPPAAGVTPVLMAPIGPATEWGRNLQGIDVVVHLAARVHVMSDTAIDPLAEYRRINVAATANLAMQAAAAGVRRFVYLSSVKVNGEGGTAPYSEQDVPAPSDPYGISKHEAETALRRVARETGLGVVILRPPLAYGPGVRANFRLLLDLVRRGIPLPLELVENRRSLIYLGNLVDAISFCCFRPEADGKTYLVSDGEDVSTPELIRRIAAAMGKEARLFPFPLRAMRLLANATGKTAQLDRLFNSLVIDSSRIGRELGWSPPFTMEQGLAETARWLREEGSPNPEEKVPR